MGKLRIGNVELENNIILAPMAGVTDLPFRLLCKEQGAGLVCMEMISAKAILYKNKNTESLLEIHPGEGQISLQLFGSEPKIMGDIAKQIEMRPFSILDINMGCPMPKIVNNGDGSALMKNPKLAGEIVSAVVKSISKPVTVKIRSGFDREHINAVEMAKVIEDAGASAVAVHARTREQLYAGEADWDVIARVKDAVSIPVIGNGDVVDGESAVKMIKHTKCDGIMIGRACRGNPWIFRQIKAYLENGTILPPPSKEERKEMMLRHAALMLENKGEYTGIREMRKHVSWYTAGMPHSAKLRQEINSMENFSALKELIEKM